MKPTILKPHVLVRGRWLAEPPQTIAKDEYLEWHFPGLSGEPALVLRYLIRTNSYKVWLVADWLSPRESIITGLLGDSIAGTLKGALPDHGIAAVFNARATGRSGGAEMTSNHNKGLKITFRDPDGRWPWWLADAECGCCYAFGPSDGETFVLRRFWCRLDTRFSSAELMQILTEEDLNLLAAHKMRLLCEGTS